MMQQNSGAPHGRMHALDGLRAAMMLLGLVLHTVVSYAVAELGDAWPYDDPATTPLADFAVFFIHVFRMPIFFVLAGFFAAMLCLRRGPAGLLANRLGRIGWPFVVALLVLYPLVIGGFTFAIVASNGTLASGWEAVAALARTPAFYVPDSTLHLWFLYYLIYFYFIALGLRALCGRLPDALKTTLHRTFRVLVSHRVLRIATPALVTAVTLLPMGGVLATRTGFVPDLAVLAAYFVFFGFGWLLYREHEIVAQFGRGAWLLTIVATVLYIAAEEMLLPALRAAGEPGAVAGTIAVAQSLINAVVVWMLFYGLTGLFIRYLDRPSPGIRYIVDASYLVYLVHLPFTIWIPGLLSTTGLSVWSRMAIVLAVTTAIGFASYALWVRSTWIGQVLNGRRYARGLPGAAGAVSGAG